MRLKILPYKMGSKSSRSLSSYFNVLRVFPNGNYVPRNGDVILNWGYCGNASILSNNGRQFKILNHPTAVNNASNKVIALSLLKDAAIPCVEFVTTKREAESFINDGKMVYCRTIIRGKEGDGIVLATTIEELVDNCKLFTKRFDNHEEYRIHVFNNQVIDRVRKRKMSEEKMNELNISTENFCKYIKNFKKGWSFTRSELVVPDGIDQLAINAITALGLDFGGCDIARNKETGAMVVLEVNSACGMDEGTTTHARYCKAISNLLDVRFDIVQYNARYGCNLEHGLLSDD